MFQPRRVALAVSLLVASQWDAVIAQEAPGPEAGIGEVPAAGESSSETTYFDLRRSKDRLTQQLAERYFNLVKIQEWSSDKGTTIKAKYISHTPDLSSVTLSISKGSGAERAERAVPVARLSKTSQSRVKQIDTIQKKLDELIAAGAKGEAEPGGTPPGDPGAPMVDERGEQPPPRRSPPTRRPPRPDRELAPAEAPATPEPAATVELEPIEDGGEDPLGFGELPPNPAPGANISLPFGAPPASPGNTVPEGVKAANPKDAAAWRTDYEAFRAALTANATPEASQADLGAIKELQAAAQFVERFDSVGAEEHAQIAAKFAEIGEVTWEATLTDADVSSGDWTARLNLPPLPAPLSIGFVLDTEREPGNWQGFQAGDRVRFVGRFIDVENGDDLVVAIRFPAEAGAANTAAPTP